MGSATTADAAVLQAENPGPVRVLRPNRPERKNALTSELGWSIVQAVAAILEKRKPEFRGR
jgi:hypothetical protein